MYYKFEYFNTKKFIKITSSSNTINVNIYLRKRFSDIPSKVQIFLSLRRDNKTINLKEFKLEKYH